MSMKLNDVRRLADDKKAAIQRYGLSRPQENDVLQPILYPVSGTFAIEEKPASPPKSRASSPLRRTTTSRGIGTNNQERPPSRLEISALEHELENKIGIILKQGALDINDNESGFVYQPHKEAMELIRERILKEMGASLSSLQNEPWLTSFIKCECLKLMCDDVSGKLSDMLSVTSSELGMVLRKLRATYKQSFEQMTDSWIQLRRSYVDHNQTLASNSERMERMQRELDNKEDAIRDEFDAELLRLNAEFNSERERDKELIKQTEFKMDQMSETLKYLNGIFKTLQSDSATAKASDLLSKIHKLEKENKQLQEANSALDQIKVQHAAYEKQTKQLEVTNREQQNEIRKLKQQLARRDEVVNDLMEKEALRNAEIEKLQRISKLKDDELVAVDLKDPATSVLCIKCKKSLDDISNIRSAIMGEPGQSKGKLKYYCEKFRILLPNLKGRRPNRITAWLRGCMRAILLSKMKEDVSMYAIKGEVTKFSSFSYAWFVRDLEGLSGPQLSMALAQSDEDRWGLYYGVKSLRKDDPEAALFWSLLDDTHGEDGTEFVVYCLSVVLSIGGRMLWRQFGSAMTHGSSINERLSNETIPPYVWLDVETAKEAVRLILVRALSAHISDAMDAIDALKVRPSVADLDALDKLRKELLAEEEGTPVELEQEAQLTDHQPENEVAPSDLVSQRASVNRGGQEATHINLFLWLRLMLQQMHADQIHRGAAIRLMFETASIGALTSAAGAAGTAVAGPKSQAFGASAGHVEYPQFQSICQTLFPSLAVSDIATLYGVCFESGNHHVTADVFLTQVNHKGLFTVSLKLPPLPLLRQLSGDTASRPKQPEVAVPDASLFDGLVCNGSYDSTAQDYELYGGLEKRTVRNGRGIDVNVEELVRSKLATLIHRKLAEISPSIRHIMRLVPEKWSAMLRDSLDTVTTALADATNKSRMSKRDKGPSDSEQLQQKQFIDGVQPYIAYRRLIVLATLVRTLTDNPLLPSELISVAELGQPVDKPRPEPGTVSVVTARRIDYAIRMAEDLLGSLEKAMLLLPQDSPAQLQRSVAKYHSFERNRKTIVARRLQNCVRVYLSRDFSVPVPRSVRMCMTPGYLRNSTHSDPVVRDQQSKLMLKNREVFHEPWWAQLSAASAYAFKMNYDFKATALGFSPITLAQALVAQQYCLWGSVELSERAIQDLFVCIRAYRLGVPRLRMFSALLGDCRDLDEHVADMMHTPQAVAVYFNLLHEIHNTVYNVRYTALQETQTTAVKQLSELLGSGDTSEEAIDAAKSLVARCDAELRAFRRDCTNRIDVLFPATEDTFARMDKRELWLLDTRLLKQVARKWASAQKYISGQDAIYVELVDKLKTNPVGKAEVDDFLWVAMQQWAKLEHWAVKRSASRSGMVVRDHPLPLTEEQLQTHAANSSGGRRINSRGGPSRGKSRVSAIVPPIGVDSIQVKPFGVQVMPMLPMSNMQGLVESIYRPGEGASLIDPTFHAAYYVNRIATNQRLRTIQLPLDSSRSAVSASASHFGSNPADAAIAGSEFAVEMDRLMRASVFWDTNVNSIVEPSQRVESDQPADPADLTIASSTHSVATNLVEKPKNDTASASADANTATCANASASVQTEEDIRWFTLPCCPVTSATNPELVYLAAKKAYNIFNELFNTATTQIVEDPRLANNHDVARKLQVIRVTGMRASETFHAEPLEVGSHGHAMSILYKSFRLHGLQLKCPGERAKTSSSDLQSALHLIDELRAGQAEYRDFGKNAWNVLQALSSAVAELMILLGREMPKDAWHAGAKLHVDRAFVYNVPTRNSVS